MRRQLRRHNRYLTVAAKIAHVHYFHCPRELGFLASLQKNEFWPKENGEPLVPTAFINKRDLVRGRAAWMAIILGKQDEAELFYRLSVGGKDIHINVYLSTLDKGDTEIFGVLKDVTELSEEAIRNKEIGDMFQLVLDHIPNAVFVKDYNNGGRFLLCNKRCMDMGMPADAVGKTDYDVFSAKVAAKFTADDRTVFASGKPLHVRESILLPNGTYYESQTIKVGLDRNGQRLLIGIAHDVSALIHSQKATEESNRLFSDILDNIPAGILVRDISDNFRYVIVNRTAANMFGMSKEDACGKNNEELRIHSDLDIAFIREEDERVARTGESVDRIGDLHLRTGESLVLRILKVTIRTDGRHLILTLAFDVSEQIRLQSDRKRLLEDARSHFDHEHTLNQCLEIVALGKHVAASSVRILRKISVASGVDGTCLLRLDRDTGELSIHEMWFSPDCDHSISPKTSLRINISGESLELLDSGGWISVDDTHAPTTPLQSEIVSAFAPLGGCSLLLNGVRKRGRIWGIAVFIGVKMSHHWSESQVRMIGSLARIMGIALESQQHLADLEYGEAEKRLILDSVDLPILLFGHDEHFVQANRAGRRLLGLFEMSSSFIHTPAGSSDWPVGPLVHEAMLDGSPVRRELTIAGREYTMAANPILDFTGVVKNVVVVGVDMTEFNKNSRRMAQAMKEARAAEKAKSYFLATMSHELRTPLNAVIGYSELMQAQQLTEKERLEGLKSIHFAGNALLTLVNDILDLSKLEADQMELVREYINLDVMIDNILGIFRLRCKEKGISLIYEPAQPTCPYLMLDGVRLRQVLLNIVGNAVKFTDVGHVVLKASFHLSDDAQAGRLLIVVEDTGSGIDPRYQERIFRPFEQQPQENKRVRGQHAYEGTGLGLAISRRLIDKMGGHIELKSELGKGSVFSIVLENIPFQKQLPAALVEDATLASVQHARKVTVALIVDDVQMNLNILSAVLKKLDISVVACLSAKAALAALESQRPDIIFTDLWMPEMDGVAFAEALRARGDTAEIPRVAITADTQFAYSAENSNFSAVLFKPITIAKIQEILSRVETENLVR